MGKNTIRVFDPRYQSKQHLSKIVLVYSSIPAEEPEKVSLEEIEQTPDESNRGQGECRIKNETEVVALFCRQLLFFLGQGPAFQTIDILNRNRKCGV